jgi:hypothetical protein
LKQVKLHTDQGTTVQLCCADTKKQENHGKALALTALPTKKISHERADPSARSEDFQQEN